MTRFYVLPDLATLTELTGMSAPNHIRYKGVSVFHLGQDIPRQTGIDENDEPITEISEGYHINTSAPIPELAAYEVFPTNPITTF